MEYIHEDRDLLMGLQDDLSDMLFATGKYTITLDEIVQNYMPYIPVYLIENEDEIRETYSDRIDEDDNLFIFDRDRTRAKISRNNLMDYIHEDRDLLIGLQDDLSEMLWATGQFSITLDEIVQNYMPFIPLYLIENEDEIKQAYPDRVTDDEYIFIFDRDMTPNEITLNVEWRD